MSNAETADRASGPDLSTRLALERTRLAHERTQMAWVRTATALISFGFTIYKFFQYRIEKGDVEIAERLVGPREFAFVMIGIGLIALLLSTVQHWHGLRLLRLEYGKMPVSVSAIVAGLISLLGILAVIGVILRE